MSEIKEFKVGDIVLIPPSKNNGFSRYPLVVTAVDDDNNYYLLGCTGWTEYITSEETVKYELVGSNIAKKLDKFFDTILDNSRK